VFLSQRKTIFSPSSDCKTFLVIYMNSNSGVMEFYEVKLVNGLPHEMNGKWCIRKEYTEQYINKNKWLDDFEYTPRFNSPKSNPKLFSLTSFWTYLKRYEITLNSRSKSRSKNLINKNRSIRWGKKGPCIVTFDENFGELYNNENVTCKNKRSHISLLNLKINTPTFTKNNNKVVISTRDIMQNPSCQFTGFGEEKDEFLEPELDWQGLRYCNLDDPSCPYLIQKHHDLPQNTRYETKPDTDSQSSHSFQNSQFSQRFQNEPRTPLQELKRYQNKQDEDVYQFDLRDTKNVGTPVEHMAASGQSDLNFSKEIPANIHPVKFFKKVFESFSEQSQNVLNFSSKNNTKCVAATIKNTSELGVTQKIEDSSSSPSTKKIMKIQNQKIKILQGQVVQLLSDKHKSNFESGNYGDKLVHNLNHYENETKAITRQGSRIDSNIYQNQQNRIPRSVSWNSKNQHFYKDSGITWDGGFENYSSNRDKSMIVNEMYEDHVDHSWIKILSNKLYQIDETAQYEDDSSSKIKMINLQYPDTSKELVRQSKLSNIYKSYSEWTKEIPKIYEFAENTSEDSSGRSILI
jgi:hypothetical protein